MNKEQLEAIRYGKGPLLIIAGAGTGKTTVITERIKYLVSQNLAKPSEILALTFTDKAAREMEERVDMAMPYGYTQMWISTFHSFCDRILRAEALHIGLNPAYNLLTQAGSLQYLRQNLFKFDLKYFRPLGNPYKFIDGLLHHFSRLKDEDVSPSDYIRWVQSQKSKVKNQNKEEREKYLELARAYQKYEEMKVKNDYADFSDLITNTLKLFRTRKNVLITYQKQFKYILVDEFQDTNYAQYALLKLLAPLKTKPNLTVVGDDSQSIYKFRGAAISNILQFMEDYPKTKRVILTKNYRSSQIILDYAHRLIKYNDPDTLEAKLGISKNLKAVRKIEEKMPEFIHTDRVENEAEAVVKTIQGLKFHNDYKWNDFAILVRANVHAEPFSRALSRAGIPHQFLGPGRLFRQPEIKDLIAYLKILANFEDSVAMYRVLAMDYFGLKARDLAAIANFAKKKTLSLFEACEQIEKIFVSQETKEIIKKIVVMINRHLKMVPKQTAGQILYYFLEDTGLLRKMVDYKTVDDERRAQNISKFFNKLKTYEAEHEDSSVFVVSDWIDLSMELGESPLAADIDWSDVDAVNILTVHSSKGLEFPVVFLVNLVAQRFPTIERREQIPIPEALIKEILPVGDYHLEEERRLFYVGITRARDQLFLTAADYYGEAKREKKLSSFIIEALGKEVVKPLNQLTKNNQLSLLEWKETVGVQPISGQPTTRVNYLSYSHIQTFQECPFHYKLKYLLRIPTPSSSAQSFGTSLHAALRDFYRTKKIGENPQEKELLNLLEKNWLAEGYKDKHHEKLSFEKGKKLLRNFWEQAKDLPVLPLALEQQFSFPLKNLWVGGRIDRVDPIDAGRKIEIIDYKTGAKTPSQKEIDKDLQMTIYALAATEVVESPFRKKPEDIQLSFYFLETGKKITTSRTKEQLTAAKKDILSWAEKISQSDFRCRGSQLCHYCEYRLLCEADII